MGESIEMAVIEDREQCQTVRKVILEPDGCPAFTYLSVTGQGMSF